MKKLKMPAVFGLLSVLGYVLRHMVYAVAVDGKDLILSGHPAVIGLWALTAAALALAAYGCRKEWTGSQKAAFMGHGLLGVAVAVTVLQGPAPAAGVLGLMWKVLGAAAALTLMAAAWERLRGRAPAFGLYALPCLFFAVHVVAGYQLWCSNPQFTDYAFALLGSVCLCVHFYQLCAVPEGMGSRRLLRFAALAAMYLCAAEIPQSLYPMLYFTAALFSLTTPAAEG